MPHFPQHLRVLFCIGVALLHSYCDSRLSKNDENLGNSGIPENLKDLLPKIKNQNKIKPNSEKEYYVKNFEAVRKPKLKTEGDRKYGEKAVGSIMKGKQENKPKVEASTPQNILSFLPTG